MLMAIEGIRGGENRQHSAPRHAELQRSQIPTPACLLHAPALAAALFPLLLLGHVPGWAEADVEEKMKHGEI